jgi:hypothetical protein
MRNWLRVAAIVAVTLASVGTIWAESRACDPTCCPDPASCPITSCAS